MSELLIGVDAGTTGIRSMVFDRDLNVLGEEYKGCSLIRLSDRYVEQDANEWWKLVKTVVKTSIDKSTVNPEEIKAISVSSQGIAIVPVDKNCNTLRNAISWLDTRASDETNTILEKYNAFDVYKKTGKRINETYTLPKIMWIKNNEPEIYNQTYKFLMPHDYIIAKMCGIFATDHTMASGTMAYNIHDQNWWSEILEACDIDISKLPDIKQSAAPQGTLLKSAADEMGLPKEVIVSVGGQDQKLASLGAGIGNDIITVSLGTATAIEKIFDYPIIDPKMRIPSFTYLFKNQWVAEGVVSTSGVSLNWLKNTLFKDKTYKDLDNIAKEVEDTPSSIFFFPFLSGCGSPHWYKNAAGCFYGISLATSEADIIKSVLEGVAYQIRENIEVMESNDGQIKKDYSLRVMGGGASSDIWLKIIANITGKTVSTLYTHETACVGAAILSGIGAGIFNNEDEAKKNIKIRDVYYSEKNCVNAYNRKYEEYIKMQDKIMG